MNSCQHNVMCNMSAMMTEIYTIEGGKKDITSLEGTTLKKFCLIASEKDLLVRERNSYIFLVAHATHFKRIFFSTKYYIPKDNVKISIYCLK